MNSEDASGRDGKTSADSSRRKPYVPPALRVYGDVAELTRALAQTSKVLDGGSGNMQKTS